MRQMDAFQEFGGQQRTRVALDRAIITQFQRFSLSSGPEYADDDDGGKDHDAVFIHDLSHASVLHREHTDPFAYAETSLPLLAGQFYGMYHVVQQDVTKKHLIKFFWVAGMSERTTSLK